VPHERPVNVVEVPVAVPTRDPLRYRPYPVTPTLSEDAPHDNDTLVCVDDETARPDGVDGACVSPEHAAVVTVVVAFDERLPAASKASTANVYDVPHARLATEKLVPAALPTCDPFR
jgi:hypothetical protein